MLFAYVITPKSQLKPENSRANFSQSLEVTRKYLSPLAMINVPNNQTGFRNASLSGHFVPTKFRRSQQLLPVWGAGSECALLAKQFGHSQGRQDADTFAWICTPTWQCTEHPCRSTGCGTPAACWRAPEEEEVSAHCQGTVTWVRMGARQRTSSHIPTRCRNLLVWVQQSRTWISQSTGPRLRPLRLRPHSAKHNSQHSEHQHTTSKGAMRAEKQTSEAARRWFKNFRKRDNTPVSRVLQQAWPKSCGEAPGLCSAPLGTVARSGATADRSLKNEGLLKWLSMFQTVSISFPTFNLMVQSVLSYATFKLHHFLHHLPQPSLTSASWICVCPAAGE